MKLFKIPFLGSTIAVTRPRESMVGMSASLSIKVKRGTESVGFFTWLRETINLIVRGDRADYGVVCRRMVTTEGVTFLANVMANTTDYDGSTMNQHVWGTGTGAEAVGNTQASFTYAAPTNDSSNAVTGTAVADTVGVNATFTSVATITAEDGQAITEHGIIQQNLAGSALFSLLDRSKFAAINVVAGNEVTFTYVLTLYAGS